jgi:hypothetical protein
MKKKSLENENMPGNFKGLQGKYGIVSWQTNHPMLNPGVRTLGNLLLLRRQISEIKETCS